MLRLLVLAVLAGSAVPASAADPQDAADLRARGEADMSAPDVDPGRRGVPSSARPRRRVTGGPDYVGSDYGLGKPSFSGIGSRPDWGRSSIE